MPKPHSSGALTGAGEPVSGDGIRIARDDDAVLIVREAVVAELVPVAVVEEDPGLGVVRDRVLLKAAVVQTADEVANVSVGEDGVPRDRELMGVEHVDAGLVRRQAVRGSGDQVDLAMRRLGHEQA
jgi:hypothetical protein